MPHATTHNGMNVVVSIIRSSGVSDTNRENPWSGCPRLHGVSDWASDSHGMWVSSKNHDREWARVGGTGRPSVQCICVFFASNAPSSWILTTSLGAKKLLLLDPFWYNVLNSWSVWAPLNFFGLCFIEIDRIEYECLFKIYNLSF